MRPALRSCCALLLALLAAALVLNAILAPIAPAPVRGRVEDQNGPLAGARVRFKGQKECIFTGHSGGFRLSGRGGRSERVTAWKEGYLIGGIPAGSSPLYLRLSRLPAEDCDDYCWVEPTPDPARGQNCGNCHLEIYQEWSASGHARAANGRRFLNLYDGSDWHGRQHVGWNLLGDRPDGAAVCTACHAPTVGSFNDPAYADLRRAQGSAAQGVHCDYCHKVTEVDNDQIGLTHGRFGLKLLRPAEGQLFFGPLDDVDRGEDTFAPVYRESRYCASCHEGIVFGVHIYGTYSEWLASPAAREGKQCQTCHMAATGSLTNIAPGQGGIGRDPQTLANHRFFAGSKGDMLRRCLKLRAAAMPGPGGIRIEIEVRAEQVGHRVPTGFVDRNLLLVVKGLDEHSGPVPAGKGPVLPEVAGPDLSGQPGKLYAKLLQDFSSRSPAPFWRANPDATDTRLFPDNSDKAVFAFPARLAQVRIRLLYRRFWQQVADAKSWPDNEIVVLDHVWNIPHDRTSAWLGP